jgi:hypothetical protein
MNNFDLDTLLIELPSASGRDEWSIRHACSGVAIFGATSSGKSSGSGRLLALKYLAAGFGGLVLTVKPDDVEVWRSYCAMTGRTDDLVVIEPKGKHFFNILDHAAGYGTSELDATDNIVEVLTKVIESGQVQDGGKGDDVFWRDQLQLLITNTIDLCKLAYNRVSVQTMYDIIQTIPHGIDELRSPDSESKAFQQAFMAAQTNVNSQIDVWAATLSQDQINSIETDNGRAMLEAVPDARLFKFINGYFVDELIPLSEKTRSIIQVSVSAFMSRLLREPFYTLFCKQLSTITPEDCFDGKIVLINLPVKRYHKVGRDIQMAVKLLFVRSWEQRDVNTYPRPCFLFVDEAQTFLTENDADFLTTARSSRIATVFLSQSLSNYYAAMGGQKAEYRVRSLMGNLGTKIFHANTDEATNEFASKLIGDAYFEDQTESVTVAQNFAQTRGRSLKLERVARPEQFVQLLTGGPRFGLRVEGYLHRQGESFANGWNHIKMVFRQDYKPQ